MAYVYSDLGGFTKEQEQALYDLDPADIRKLDPERRLELAIQHAEVDAARKESFWNAVQAFATGALPILAFFGITKIAGRGK